MENLHKKNKECNHDFESGISVFVKDDIKIEAECIYCKEIILFDFNPPFSNFEEK